MSSSSNNLLATHANCLPIGTRVSDFEIIGLIGEGGFGIVYLAKDVSLDRIIALKEFMPAAFAGRIDGIRVAVRAANHSATFDAGLKSFINEAKMLAKFAHPALLEVFRFWEGNGTAYMAMRLYKGETLRQRLSGADRAFSEDDIAQTMGPIFDALEMLHREQVFHRDIAPDNIMLTDGRSVLLDFGAARRIIGDGTQALTTVLKPGYAPIEQYSDDGTMKQGAWTDVYALGGVLYHMATGKAPIQAVSRMLTDPLLSIREATGEAFSANFSDAVRTAMSVHVDNRFRSVTEFREALGWNVGLRPRVITLPVTAPKIVLQPELAMAPASGKAAAALIAPALSEPTTGDATHSVSPAPPFVAGEPSHVNRSVLVKSKVPIWAALALGVGLLGGVGLWLAREAPTEVPQSAVSQAEKKQESAMSSGAGRPVAPISTPAMEPPKTSSASDEPAGTTASDQIAHGTLKLQVSPWGAVAVSGVSRGISPPLKELLLPVGTHTVEVSRPDYAPITRTIEVTKDASITLVHTFSK